MFDAGAIEASLTVRTDQFNKDMDAAEARVKKFESEPHKVKISAVFDQSSLSRARQMFAQLDNQISKDAMSRLRSSPQGSVLGALNALFSPHSVTGAPSASQAASGGLLGKMVSGSGGGTGSLPGSQGKNSGPTPATGLGQVLTGQAPGNTTTTNTVKEKITGAAPGNTTTTNTVKEKITGNAPGNTTTTNTVKERIDPASQAAAEKGIGDSGNRAGTRFFSGFSMHTGPFFAGLIRTSNTSGTSMGKGLLSGIGPGILGMSALFATKWVGGIGSALAALPALAGVAGVGMGVALTGGMLALVVKGNAQLKASFASLGKQAETMFTEAAKPIIPAFSAVLNQVPALLKQIEPQLAGIFKTVAPQLQQVFSGLVPVIQGLLGVMQAAAPAFGPFITGIESLVANILPGLQAIIRATVPFISQFAGILGTLGKNLGGMFAAMAPAVGASMKVLTALLGVVGGLLPIVGQLAAVFAKALAPVFTQLAGVITALEPALVLVGKIFASLAGAILGDLVSAFGALATLVKAAAPGLTILAGALGQVFTVLENTGVFAILGNALENLAAPLGNMITALAKGLAPILPPVIKFIAQMAALLASTLSGAVVAILPSLTKLATTALGAIAKILPLVLPLLAKMAGIFTAALVSAVSQIVPPLVKLATTVLAQLASILPQVLPPLIAVLTAFTPVLAGIITDIAKALAAIITAIPPSVLTGIALAIGAIWLAVKAWGIYQAILDAELFANPIGLIVLAVAALAIGITELVTHWTTVWHAITSALDDAWGHINSAVLIPMEQFFTVTIPGWWDTCAAAVMTHFVTPIENAFKGAWDWVVANVWDPVQTFFTATLPGWLTAAIGFVNGNFVTPFENAMKAAWDWVVANVWNPVDTFFTATIPGWFDTFIGLVGSKFVTPFENAVKGAWDWVVSNVFTPMETFITQTIPGWFGTAVSAIGSFWNGVEQIVRTPVAFVVNDVLNPIGQTFDKITSALGLGNPIPALSMAAGGLIMQGTTGTADDVLIRASKGETVVSAADSKILAPLFAELGIPGYAAGGIIPGIITGAIKNTLNAVIPGLGTILGVAGTAVSSSVVQGALDKILGLGTGGAAGDVKSILVTMGSKAVADMVSWFTGKEAAASAAASAAVPGGKAGAGVQQWKGLVDQALKMLGLPASLDAQVLYQMQTESGGNPNAINLTDSNAAAGDPSRGLLQTIGTTFAAYHVAGTSSNIYDPLANIAAAINYARATYGPTLMSGGMGMGSGHGYDRGGYLKPGYTLAYNGTSRPELVTPAGAGGASFDDVIARLDKLIRATEQVPAGVGAHVGGAINGASAAASFRARYPRGGA